MEKPGKESSSLPPDEKRLAQLLFRLGTDCRKNMETILQQATASLGTPLALFLKKDSGSDRLIVRSHVGFRPDTDPAALAADVAGLPVSPDAVCLNTADIRTRTDLNRLPVLQAHNIRSCLLISVPGSGQGLVGLFHTRCREFSPEAVQRIHPLVAALSLEEKRLENEADSAPAELAEIREKYQREKSRARDLEKKLERAEKMELIGIMAGGVAHDLNNILSGLVSYPELLLMQIDKNSPLFDPISFINDAGLQAAEIVQDLLTLTRRGIPRTDILNLNNIIHTYFNNPAHRRLENNHPHIRFSTDSEADLLNIKGSEPHISKLVMNLVTNAAEAVGQYGNVRIETLNRYVDDPAGPVRELQEGEYVVLRVTDDGEGIPEEDLNRIFEPFYTKKQMGRSGSGLGLSVVWHAVKDHNGHIDVQSEPDKGTCFELYFPATREASESAASGFELEPLKGDRERILVIDDVKEQLQIASKCLDMLGYTPFTVDSGEKAVEFLHTRQVDLLILDMQMEPGIDGLETYERILEIHPGQKAIIASGYSETRRVKRALRLGAGQYIKKPYTIQKLAVAIRRELHPESKTIKIQ